ncbi:hypothetical protein BDD12DRAFT_910803 [Trichophaea hybrida]|nr:hypothetical protein BDD12DRAFT_910803 [Trichophaea hybrida]
MSHLVYKKNLREEKVRDKYVVDRRDLRKAREAGIIDQKGYEEAKKQITPVEIPRERARSIPDNRSATGRDRANSVYSAQSGGSSTGSIPSPTAQSTKVKKGTIFDRNNLQVRIYKPDAQTEEQRESKKQQRKEQLYELEAASRLGRSDEPNIDILRSSEEYQRFWGSVSSEASTGSSSVTGRAQKSNRFGFLRPKKSVDQHAALPQFPLRNPTPTLDPPMPILSRTSSKNCDYRSVPTSPAQPASQWAPERSISNTTSSTRSRSRKASVATIQSTAPLVPTTTKPDIIGAPTLADRILFGVKPAPAPEPELLPGAPLSRRHSYSSGRPSIAASRHSWKWPAEEPPGTSGGDSIYSVKSRGKAKDELPYGLTNGYDESHYTPLSLLLLDVFTSLLSEFESTPKIFGFARDEEYQSSCAASMVEQNFHPGQLVGFGDEQVDLKDALKKRVWFLTAVKWLYFGRILFSPGHHLLMMGRDDPGDGGPPKTGDELRVLDLDGPAMADWAWHTALEYPDTFVYVTFSCDSPMNSPVSPLTAEYASPHNLRRVQLPVGHTSLAPLQTGSMDVISSRFLPSFVPKDGWLPLVLELGRVLKSDGYIELTILDPVLNDMGPLLRTWILDNVLSDPSHPRTFDIMPSKSVLSALREAGFEDIQKVWMWMPATSVGDELSTVTSGIGRYLYDELYSPRTVSVEEESGATVRKHVGSEVWTDERVMEECRQCNTAFRWLKIWIRKSSKMSG